jgi:hypothetical protein
LQSLHILGSGYYISPPEQTVLKIKLSMLVPLFSFSNLTDVQITIDASIKLKDAGLMNIAEAWPKLMNFAAL